MSQYDTEGLYEFLSSTPEKGLRSMLVDANFTEAHFNILMKVVRVCNSTQFAINFEGNQFPKIRFNEKEAKLKESFWKACETCFLDRGILFPAVKKAAA